MLFLSDLSWMSKEQIFLPPFVKVVVILLHEQQCFVVQNLTISDELFHEPLQLPK